MESEESHTNDMLIDKACVLLSKCRFLKTTKEEIALEAILILEQFKLVNKLYLHTIPRGLVEYPELLTRYLKVLDIDNRDLKSMICRCVEIHPESNIEST